VRQYLAVLEWIGADKSARNRIAPTRAASLTIFDDSVRSFN
jgi:hypothetical protein